MEIEKPRAVYYIRFFKVIEHLQDFCSSYLYMNNVKNFSKYDDGLINDITEGRVCNQEDGVTATWGGQPLGNHISIPIDHCFIYCLFELFEGDFKSNNNNINVTSKKFSQFVTSYIGNQEKFYIALINAKKFDSIISDFFKDKPYYFKRIEFVEYDLVKRMESYLKGDVVSLLFQKRPKYREKLSEKRLCVYCPNKENEERDFIKLKIEGINNSILFKGFIDKDMVLRQSILQNSQNVV